MAQSLFNIDEFIVNPFVKELETDNVNTDRSKHFIQSFCVVFARGIKNAQLMTLTVNHLGEDLETKL